MLTKINLYQQVQTFLMFYFVCKYVQCRQMLSKLSILVVTFGITEHNKEVLAGQYEHVVYFWSFSFQESRRRFAKIFRSCSAQVLCTVGQKGYSFIYILELNSHFEDIILLAALAVTKFSKCTVSSNTPNASKFIGPNCLPSPKVLDFNEKSLHQGSIVCASKQL